MPMETRSSSALFKRAEQLKRWEESETNRISSDLPKDKKRRIRFSDGCVFLAACAAGDKEEVERLLNHGADINTANVDGLTALHQACIDDNYEMVQFLVEHKCDINRGDNEGWTPLHATASCGILSIARYLIEHGADVAAVNNDGELPIDIAESEEMEELFQEEIERQEIDCEAARTEEERVMLEDAKRWANNQHIEDCVHPKTGATSLHVASAKGYVRVMSILIKAGADVNAQDNDDWTPLHAAAHWGQREACEILAESLADMNILNSSGQTCFDVADPDLVKLLEELKKKQNSLQKPEIKEIDQRKAPPPLKRRTSVNRMSVADKNNVVIKDTFSERMQIEAKLRFQDVREEKDRKQLPGIEVELETTEDIKKKDNEISIKNKVNQVENAKDISSVEIANPDKLNLEENIQPLKVTVESETSEMVKLARRKEISKSGGDNEVVTDLKTLQDEKEEIVMLRKPKRDSSADQKNIKTQHITDEISKNKNKKNEDENQSKVPICMPSNQSENHPLEATAQAVTTPQIRRSFVPPVRDEESETQRKAHAKRVRETRRSTQGVTLEDLKSAEQQLLKKQQEDDERQERENKQKRSSSNEQSNLNTKVSAISSMLTKPVTKEEKRISLHNEKEDLKENQDDANSTEVKEDKSESSQEEQEQKNNKRKDIISSSSDSSERLSWPGNTDSKKEPDRDYKRLYRQLREENKSLKERLKQMENELDSVKQQLQKTIQNNSRNSLSDAEKRERRSLERKISELEEELTEMDQLKVDNQRLRDENGALIRVISKLSK